MKVVADSRVILDFLDGLIEDPFRIIHPYRIILISPVVLHEVLRAYPLDEQAALVEHLKQELLPVPTLGHWIESAQIMRDLYPKPRKQNIARMQNDVLISLSARDIRAPVWTRDADFGVVCNYLGVGLLKEL